MRVARTRVDRRLTNGAPRAPYTVVTRRGPITGDLPRCDHRVAIDGSRTVEERRSA